MHPSLALWIVLDAFATYRLARLVTADAIFDRPRGWIKRRGSKWALFITCPWCTSMYLAAGVVVLTRLAPRQWVYAALVLSFSAAAGLMATVGG